MKDLTEIDSSTQDDAAKNLELFKNRLQQGRQITNGIVNILSSFEKRLSKLEETVLPLYNQTEKLQLRQKNVESALQALDHVISFYGVSAEVESIIKAGPCLPYGLETFINSLDKLKQAQIYFERNNPQSVELENVASLYSTGVDALNREFKELLVKHSRPVQPITLLDLLANDDDSTMEDSTSVSSLGHFPDHVLNDLTTITEWLITVSRDEFMNVYAKVRATTLMKSLTLLKEHQRSGSGSSMQGVTGSPTLRPKFQNRLEPPSSRKVRRIQNVFERKANKMLLKASQTLEYSTGLTILNRKSGEGKEDLFDEQEMENYLMMAMASQKLMQHELHLLSGIVPTQHQQQVFQIIVKEVLEMIDQDGQSIANRVRRCIQRHDFLAALVIFPTLKHVLQLKPDLERTIDTCDMSAKSQFTNILNTLHNAGSKFLEVFVESIRSDNSSSLPRDGTVYQLTCDVLFFLEQLIDYMDIVAVVLAQDLFFGNAYAALVNSSKGVDLDKNKTLLGIYIKKVLAQLNHTLMSKSDVYSDVGLKGLFRINNFNYILKSLQRSSLLELLLIVQPDCEETYSNLISTHKNTYQLCWTKVLGYISSTDDIHGQSGKFRDKEKSSLKEKFAGFNKEMEEISKFQRGYSIPDVELREGLKRDNKETILPKYNAFYDKYASSGFVKNREKYVKYTPEMVATLLDRFFDAAA